MRGRGCIRRLPDRLWTRGQSSFEEYFLEFFGRLGEIMRIAGRGELSQVDRDWNGMMSEESIFIAALEKKTPEERAAFLDAACAGDEAMRRRVEALLASDEGAGSFLLQPPSEAQVSIAIGVVNDSESSPLSSPSDDAEAPGSRIGPYRLIEKIGEGGMGMVYVAQQERPVKRLVALKIVKPGMDSRQVIARFEAERQTLALMNHPNIATVFDAGMTEQKRPYFVMELVKGVPITQFCDENQLTPRERLELFIPVCEAIQHAHQKGIIHRDIKPGNVLVACYDERAVPKVIDYGVAKALGPSVIDDAAVTAFGGIVGTLQYMSPELATFNALDVDTRSDVYALGALLYELLTGSPPLKEKLSAKVAVQALLEVIRETEPQKPSTRLSGSGAALPALAARRRVDPAALGREFRGELDLIVMKALQKDRSQRYDSAGGLARDVRHYLAGEAVEACPPTLRYRMGKFLHRHRGPVIAGGLVLAALLAGVIGTTLGMVRAREAADDEAKQRKIADHERGVATANAARALEKEAEAQKNAAAAELRVVEGLVLQGDAMAQGGRWAEAKQDYWEAYHRFVELDASPFRAEVGLCAAYAVSPPPLFSVEGHTGLVRALAFSPDGRRALCSETDNTVILWDLLIGRPMRTIRANASSVAFSPDGQRAISCSFLERRIQLWDLQTGKELLNIPASEQVRSVAFTPDGRRAVTCGITATPSFWDLETGKRIGAPARGLPLSEDFAISADMTRALGGYEDGTLKVWDPSTGREERTIKAHSTHVNVVAVSSDGLCGLSAADSTLKLWDLRTGRELQMFSGHNERINIAVFSPSGKQVLSGGGAPLGWSGDNNVRLWNAATGKLLLTLSDHTEAIHALAYAPDGRMGLSGSGAALGRGGSSSIKLWNLRNNADEASLVGHNEFLSGIAPSPDSRLALCGGSDGILRLWDLPTGKIVRNFRGHTDTIRCVAMSRDGLRALSGSNDYTLRLWDVRTGRTLRKINFDGPVTGAAFGPDGRWALASTSHRMAVWDLESGKELRNFGPDEPINQIALSPDGRWVVAGCGGPFDSIKRPLTLWDVQSGREVASLMEQNEGGTSAVAFSADGRFVLSGGYDRVVLLWDVQSRKLVKEMAGNADLVGGVGFSPDGKWAISGGIDGTVRIWDLGTGKELRMLGGHASAAAGSVAFTPNGGRVLSAYSDQSVRVWDFARAAAYADIETRATVARTYLEAHPDYPPALRALAEWYWFRGVYDWAVDLATRARSAGEEVSPLMMGRCYWQLSDELPKNSELTREACLAAARREFAAALAQSSDTGARAYLKLLLDSPGLNPGSAQGASTRPASPGITDRH